MQPAVESICVPLKGLSAPLTVCHITDSHLCECDARDHEALQAYARQREDMFTRRHPGILTKRLREMIRLSQDADILVLTGDIIDFPSAANADALAECLEENHIPLLYTYGNHDKNPYLFEENEAALQRNLAHLRSILPDDPTYAHLDAGGVRFVGLDDSLYQISPVQTEKLKADLSCGLPVVLCMHIPLYASTLYEPTCAVWHSPLLTALPEELLPNEGMDHDALPAAQSTRAAVELLQNSRALSAVMAGHIHFSHDDVLYPGVIQHVCANSAEVCMRRIQFVPAEA